MNHPHNIEANQHLSILFLSLVPSELVAVFIAADIPKKKYNALINEFLFELHQDLFENGKLSVILRRNRSPLTSTVNVIHDAFTLLLRHITTTIAVYSNPLTIIDIN